MKKINPKDVKNGMRIRILDEEGKPLEGAMLCANTVYPEGYNGDRITTEHHTADANGTIWLRGPQRPERLKLWPNKSGYVGLFRNFDSTSGNDGDLIPEEYEFRLAKGHPVSGRIVDDKGNPVEGVHVQVKVDDAPGVSTWLTDSFGQPTVKTDSDGRWHLDNAPGPLDQENDCTFELKLSHDDYVADKYWGESQRAQGIGSIELRQAEVAYSMR